MSFSNPYNFNFKNILKYIPVYSLVPLGVQEDEELNFYFSKF